MQGRGWSIISSGSAAGGPARRNPVPAGISSTQVGQILERIRRTGSSPVPDSRSGRNPEPSAVLVAVSATALPSPFFYVGNTSGFKDNPLLPIMPLREKSTSTQNRSGTRVPGLRHGGQQQRVVASPCPNSQSVLTAGSQPNQEASPEGLRDSTLALLPKRTPRCVVIAAVNDTLLEFSEP